MDFLLQFNFMIFIALLYYIQRSTVHVVHAMYVIYEAQKDSKVAPTFDVT